MKRIYIKFRPIFFLTLFIFILASCNKEASLSSVNKNTSEINNLRQDSLEFWKKYFSYLDVDYFETYDIIKEHLLYHQGVYEPYEYFFSESQYNEMVPSIDSINNLYSSYSLEELLDELESQGLFSSELKDQFLVEMENYLATSLDHNDYYLQRQQEILASDMNEFEISTLQNELAIMHAFYEYTMEVQRNYEAADSLMNGQINFRDENVCEIDWEAVALAAAEGSLGGFLISLPDIIKKKDPKKTKTKKIATAFFKAILGAMVGGAIEWWNQFKDTEFCKECLVLSLSKEFTHLCDDGAYYTPHAGSKASSFSWVNVNAIPSTATTVPGQTLLLHQVDPNFNIVMDITSNCLNKDHEITELTAEWKDNIHTTQALVPAGDLSILGKALFNFKKPTNDSYASYYYEVTEDYNLSGLAFSWPEIALGGVSTVQNAKSVSLNGQILTVTWKVDRAHWDEFLSNQTEGIVKLTTNNLCPDGQTKDHYLKVLIKAGLGQHK